MPMKISQHWFRWCLGVVRQQTITRANVDQDPCRHMAKLGQNHSDHYRLHHFNCMFLEFQCIHKFPAGTRRNNNVMMTSKRRRDIVLTLIMTLLLRRMSAGIHMYIHVMGNRSLQFCKRYDRKKHIPLFENGFMITIGSQYKRHLSCLSMIKHSFLAAQLNIYQV